MQVDLLAERPELLLPLARAYEREWPEWYLAGGASAEADLRQRSNTGTLPLGLVAHVDGAPVGACALTREAGPIETELTPWLGGLWVHSEWRRKGIASAMVRRAASEARRLGYDRVYTLTVNAEGLMRRLGWREIDRANAEGQSWAILLRETADAD